MAAFVVRLPDLLMPDLIESLFHVSLNQALFFYWNSPRGW